MRSLSTLLVLFTCACVESAEIPKAPVPPSPYLPVIYRFADAMLERAATNKALFSATNVQHEQNFLRLLYTLSELSAKPKYRQAADAVLKSVVTEWAAPEAAKKFAFVRPWMLWDRCLEVAPEASEKLIGSLQEPTDRRQAGFYLRSWAQAYSRSRHEQWLQAINKRVGMLESKPEGTISLAIDADGASRVVPEPLAARLRTLAAKEDQAVFAASKKPKLELWPVKLGEQSQAQVGLMYLSRYHNTAKVEYRKLFLEAAEAYLGKMPELEKELWARTLGHVISLQVAAWRHTAGPEYLQQARKIADIALEKFWGTNAIPRANLRTEAYRSDAGVDTLALAMVELHLNILHITAVRCPQNTIDR